MSKPRILLIEDDGWLAESYMRVLEEAYTMIVVVSGEAAMDIMDTESFDLVIADIMLENGLVIDLLHELQSHKDTMDTPIIVCSSLASSIRVEDFSAYGVVKILDKTTMRLSDLRSAVQQALSSKAI